MDGWIILKPSGSFVLISDEGQEILRDKLGAGLQAAEAFSVICDGNLIEFQERCHVSDIPGGHAGKGADSASALPSSEHADFSASISGHPSTSSQHQPKVASWSAPSTLGRSGAPGPTIMLPPPRRDQAVPPDNAVDHSPCLVPRARPASDLAVNPVHPYQSTRSTDLQTLRMQPHPIQPHPMQQRSAMRSGERITS